MSQVINRLVCVGSLTHLDVYDEDNMISDKADGVPTQQSVKAYVDSVATSMGGAAGVSTADSKGASAGVAASVALSTGDSKASSLATLISTAESKIASYHP